MTVQFLLYRGEIGKQYAKTLSYKQNYFTQLQVLPQTEFAVITYSKKKDIQSLGLLFPLYQQNAIIKPEILEKVNDGIFDTDGKLLYDPDHKTIIYV